MFVTTFIQLAVGFIIGFYLSYFTMARPAMKGWRRTINMWKESLDETLKLVEKMLKESKEAIKNRDEEEKKAKDAILAEQNKPIQTKKSHVKSTKNTIN